MDFRDDDRRTTVVLTHSGFDGEEPKQRHEHGWTACLHKLARRVFAG